MWRQGRNKDKSAKANGKEKELKLERRSKQFKTQEPQLTHLLDRQKQTESMMTIECASASRTVTLQTKEINL